ncbi:arylsulfatase [candidate division KSB1 bacterium]|nr:arylsulfatase [candidate division KSB1 bacterium]
MPDPKESAHAPSNPNIVFIITDQMRGDCLSVSGHPVVETPNLDMLARKGINFIASYSACPSCIAARASIFTGLRPATHGRLGYRDQVPWRYPTTLVQELSNGGYQTHCIGKTHFFPQRAHLGFQSLESYEGAQNFDGKYVNDYYEWLREMSNNRFTEFDHGVDGNSWFSRPSHLPEELHNNSWVATRAVEFLKRRDPTRPFFLNLSFHRPHPPIDPPEPFYTMYKDREIQLPPVGDWAQEYNVPVEDMNAWCGVVPPNILKKTMLAYYAQIAHIDNQIGRVVIALRRLNVGPTWIIFTADHGEMLGDHFLFRKTYAYEGSAKTPLIICPPERLQNHVCDAPVSQQDFMPTILDIAGLQIPASVEGSSMLPLLSKSAREIGWRDYVHGEHSGCYHRKNGMQFLTDGKEKYIWYTQSGKEQFFDLASDPKELHDLANAPGIRDKLNHWRARMVAELAPRVEDGLSDGKILIAGKSLPAVRPDLLK